MNSFRVSYAQNDCFYVPLGTFPANSSWFSQRLDTCFKDNMQVGMSIFFFLRITPTLPHYGARVGACMSTSEVRLKQR